VMAARCHPARVCLLDTWPESVRKWRQYVISRPLLCRARKRAEFDIAIASQASGAAADEARSRTNVVAVPARGTIGMHLVTPGVSPRRWRPCGGTSC
jgi:hypothetical protein